MRHLLIEAYSFIEAIAKGRELKPLDYSEAMILERKMKNAFDEPFLNAPKADESELDNRLALRLKYYKRLESIIEIENDSVEFQAIKATLKEATDEAYKLGRENAPKPTSLGVDRIIKDLNEDATLFWRALHQIATEINDNTALDHEELLCLVRDIAVEALKPRVVTLTAGSESEKP